MTKWQYPQSFNELYTYIDLNDRNLWYGLFFTFWTPFFWNVVRITITITISISFSLLLVLVYY